MDRWDYYYNIASQEYERSLTAPYDYDEPIDEDDYDENLIETLMEDF